MRTSDVIHVFPTKNPASLMVFGAAVGDRSVMNPHLIAAALKIAPKEYLDKLKTSLLPFMEKNFGFGIN